MADLTVPHGPEPDELLARAEDALARAEGKGADAAEVYLWYGRDHDLMQGKEMATVESSDRSGVSVRVLKDGRLTGAKTSGLSEDELAWTVDRALRSAQLVPPQDSLERFAPPAKVTRPPTPVDPELWDLDPARHREIGDQIQDAVYATADPNYFSARLGTKIGLFAVANSHGVRAWDRHAHESFRMGVRCNRGDTHKTAAAFAFGREPVQGLHDLETNAVDAVERAVAATDTRGLDGFVDEIILDGVCSAKILAKILPSLSGKAADQGRSIFAERMGEQVFSKKLSVVDRPHGPGGCRHQRVDDEGTPTQEKALIENGVLKSFLYDWKGAQETAQAPNGHGLRGLTGRYSSQPNARAVNPIVEPGQHTLDEMIDGADQAVLVRDAVLGSFTMDSLSGDFSFIAPLAYHVENGTVTSALVSTNFSGNLFEMLENIQALGNEQAHYPHGAFPPIHVSEVTCAT